MPHARLTISISLATNLCNACDQVIDAMGNQFVRLAERSQTLMERVWHIVITEFTEAEHLVRGLGIVKLNKMFLALIHRQYQIGSAHHPRTEVARAVCADIDSLLPHYLDRQAICRRADQCIDAG